ncbi:MAG: hypothetical protein RLZZ612_928 [Pseudomonadota bacterium]|jgi:lipopolysaccharide biosynthesis regulator YciM
MFAAGWFASRYDIRQGRIDNHNAPKAYYKGLNHLLNEQQDAAIDAFISAIQQDPDTTDLHFALGNLFRRRGDYDRAVRVHEHLLQRADLPPKDHVRARYCLAQDFIKAGLLDRAESNLNSLKGSTHESQALVLLLNLYERTREWDKATAIAQQLDQGQEGQFRSHITHHRCEQAQQARQQQDWPQAEALLHTALQDDPHSRRAKLELADLLEHTERPEQAWDVLQSLTEGSFLIHPLALPALLRLAPALDQTAALTAQLEAAQAQAPSIDYADALAHLSPDADSRQERYVQHLKKEPHSLLAAHAWLLAQPHHQAPPEVLQAIDRACGPLRRYRCSACGFETSHHFWQCLGCQSWASYSPHRIEEL